MDHIRTKQLSDEIFRFPVPGIRIGHHSAMYFNRSQAILRDIKYKEKVVMQVFQKSPGAVLCGVQEVISLLKIGTGYYSDPSKAQGLFREYLKNDDLISRLTLKVTENNFQELQNACAVKLRLLYNLERLWVSKFDELDIYSLQDGDRLNSWETVMHIAGNPKDFIHLESVYLGILARRTRIATNMSLAVKAASGKPVYFFGDRFDDFKNHQGDGYAAWVGGASGVAVDAMGEWTGVEGSGTTNHALIACFNGNTVEAMLAFARKFPEVPKIALVDFENDCAKTSVEVAEAFKSANINLLAVRLDTSEKMVDKSLGRNGQPGVNVELVGKVRQALDEKGYKNVGILVSGGFNDKKISLFESERAPVAMYASGSWIVNHLISDFTADIVMVDGKCCAKEGRYYCPNSRMKKVK